MSRRWQGATVVLAAVGAMVVPVLIGPGDATADPVPTVASQQWTVLDQLSRTSETLAADCDGPTSCWVVEGGEVLQSRDGGSTWTDRGAALPSSITGVIDIACPSADLCRATATTADGGALVTFGAGAPTVAPIPSAPGAMALDCATALRCVATDGQATFRTTDGGASWRSGLLPRAVGAFALSCAAATSQCWVVGRRGTAELATVLRSRDGGATWQNIALPSGVAADASLYDVDCPTAQVCRIVGDDGDAALLLATGDGATLTRSTIPAETAFLDTVACTSATVCRAIGARGNNAATVLTTTDGATWTPAAVDRQVVFGGRTIDLACATGLQCLAVRYGEVWTSSGGPRDWVVTPVATVLSNARVLSCPDTGLCTVVGTDLRSRPLLLRGRPGAWVETRLPDAMGTPQAVDCVDAAHCTLLTSRPANPGQPRVRLAWRTTDGTATWQPGTIPGPVVGGTTDVSCATATVCLATGVLGNFNSDLMRTTDGGLTWTHVGSPDRFSSSLQVECPAADRCLVLNPGRGGDSLAYVTADLGASFQTRPISPSSPGLYERLACSAERCLAGGFSRDDAALASSVDGGATWAGLAIPRPAGDVGLLACTAVARWCGAATDNFGDPLRIYVSSNGGASFRIAELPAEVHRVIALDCRNDGCFAIAETDDFRTVVIGA